jgi:glutathione S-transferase
LRKIIAACDFLEENLEEKETPDIGDIALATALSWIEFRQVYAFCEVRPRLAAWYARFCERESMRVTALHGETVDTVPSYSAVLGQP